MHGDKQSHFSAKKLLSQFAIHLTPGSKSPDKLYGELFHDIQTSRVYDDGKTFVDLLPKKQAGQIVKKYQKLKTSKDFDLKKFAEEHFRPTPTGQAKVASSHGLDPRTHVTKLWPNLSRSARTAKGSLLALPYSYVVPGGRFEEQFYWDSYFVMLGLAADNRWSDINKMMANYVFMIMRFGFIPTANRTYFLSRSQPPFFADMVRLVGKHQKKGLAYVKFLPSLLTEYRFWMKGQNRLPRESSSLRVVKLADGEMLNRYYDNLSSPRPESHHEDLETAKLTEEDKAEKLFLDLRAGAESGWDFSSRWFKDPQKIETIHTTDIIPIDLNCLLYRLESLIAECYGLLRLSQPKRQFQKKADKRAEAILKYCWDKDQQIFCDYDFIEGRSTGRLTLAMVFPLYAGIATPEQANSVAKKLKADFLMPGGLATTLVENGQQWDYPNGWAPLQWVAIVGLRNYGFDELANEVKKRWTSSVETVYKNKQKMIEKYDVVSESRIGGGGEYPLQDGFGWTNGVYAALRDEDR